MEVDRVLNQITPVIEQASTRQHKNSRSTRLVISSCTYYGLLQLLLSFFSASY